MIVLGSIAHFHGALLQACSFPGNPAQNGQGECFFPNNKHKPLTGKNSGLGCNKGDVVPGQKVNVLEVQGAVLAQLKVGRHLGS